MKNQSAVQFDTQSRVYIGLAVANRERSVAFYRDLFRQEPTKLRPGYAKFEVAEPPLNLTLNEGSTKSGDSTQKGGSTKPQRSGTVSHFGVQVKSSAEVKRMTQRFQQAGIQTSTEERVACCYAVQDKVWVSDPDGNAWEVFVVLDNEASEYASNTSEAGSETACCQPADCNPGPELSDYTCCAGATVAKVTT